MRARASIAFIGLVVFVSLFAPGARSAPPAPSEESRLPAALQERLSWSDDPSQLASLLGLRTLHGRPLAESAPSVLLRRVPPAFGRPSALARADVDPTTDVPIGAAPSLTETRPSVAASPSDLQVVVAAYGGFVYPVAPTRRCAVVRSVDGGRTFGEPAFLPRLGPASSCNDPVLAWSPNGQRLYAAYRDFKGGTVVYSPTRYRPYGDDDVVVSRSLDGGRTWSSPVVALDADPWAYTIVCTPGVFPCDITDVDPGSSFERPSISTPLEGVGNQVYVTATRFAEEDPAAPPSAIAFGRSDNAGQSWNATEILDEGTAGPLPILVQGARVAGGRGGEVLVAWYHSGNDGHLAGSFEIRVRRSATNGRTWGPVVVAARDANETGRDLGPFDFYKQWWPTLFPDVAVDRSGRAHVVYGHDPEPGNSTAEEGDVRYVTSRRAPWTDWVAPITLNDDGPGRAQGYASLSVRYQGFLSAVDVVWEDTRQTPDLPVDAASLSSPNLLYDLYHARWVRAVGGGTWLPNRRVSDVSSRQDRAVSGGRTSLAANHLLLFATWTDRRSIPTVSDKRQDVYGTRVRLLF
jgi:hypothetical protein